MTFMQRHFGGHFNLGPITFYGYNAMHFAINIKSKWGWVCLKPPTYVFNRWWSWYFYISPDATPFNCLVCWGNPHD